MKAKTEREVREARAQAAAAAVETGNGVDPAMFKRYACCYGTAVPVFLGELGGMGRIAFVSTVMGTGVFFLLSFSLFTAVRSQYVCSWGTGC